MNEEQKELIRKILISEQNNLRNVIKTNKNRIRLARKMNTQVLLKEIQELYEKIGKGEYKKKKDFELDKQLMTSLALAVCLKENLVIREKTEKQNQSKELD